jgi:hypothetical protein
MKKNSVTIFLCEEKIIKIREKNLEFLSSYLDSTKYGNSDISQHKNYNLLKKSSEKIS